MPREKPPTGSSARSPSSSASSRPGPRWSIRPSARPCRRPTSSGAARAQVGVQRRAVGHEGEARPPRADAPPRRSRRCGPCLPTAPSSPHEDRSAVSCPSRWVPISPTPLRAVSRSSRRGAQHLCRKRWADPTHLDQVHTRASQASDSRRGRKRSAAPPRLSAEQGLGHDGILAGRPDLLGDLGPHSSALRAPWAAGFCFFEAPTRKFRMCTSRGLSSVTVLKPTP
jgi:hypothetical protein